MTISAVVPVYNSEQSLPELVDRLRVVLPEFSNCFEVILVNDGSSDRSWVVVQELAAQYPWVRGMNLMRNYGQHNALLAGIRVAQYEVIVTLDDDLQDPPEEIGKLLSRLGAGYDVVYGKPEVEQHGFFRNVASRVTKLALENTIGAETARKVSAFRAFRADIRNAFSNYSGPYVSVDVLLTWGATRFDAVVTKHEARRLGQSNYTLKKLVVHALNMMTGFSTLPLQFASIIGFAFTLVGFAVFCFVLLRYFLQGDVVAGFPFLASIVAIFSGAQLFALGIIGEYLARMHFRLMDRPPYVVRSETSLRES
jgi:glycosyltransferase involved in cell wall biosynthesis